MNIGGVRISRAQIFIVVFTALIGMLLTSGIRSEIFGTTMCKSTYYLGTVSFWGGFIIGLATYRMWQVTKTTIKISRVYASYIRILVASCTMVIGILLIDIAIEKLLGVPLADNLHYLVMFSSLGGLITGIATYFIWEVTKMPEDTGIPSYPTDYKEKCTLGTKEKLFILLVALSFVILMILEGYVIYNGWVNPQSFIEGVFTI